MIDAPRTTIPPSSDVPTIPAPDHRAPWRRLGGRAAALGGLAVAARNGKQYTVTLSPSTRYGTKAAPASVAQFPVGAQVAVTGTVTGTTVNATRIATPKAPAGAGATSATPAPTPA